MNNNREFEPCESWRQLEQRCVELPFGLSQQQHRLLPCSRPVAQRKSKIASIEQVIDQFLKFLG